MRVRNFVCRLTAPLAVLLGVPAQATEPLPQSVLGLISRHCIDCHDADSKKGDVNLDFTSVDLQVPRNAELLERIHRALATGEMPPPKKDRPPAADKDAALSWLDDTLVRKVPRHAPGLRRLTRVEYERTVGKVFGISFKAPEGFPADTVGSGFEGVAESLMVSPPLLEAYLESATQVADLLFPPPPKPPPPPRRWILSPEDLSYDTFPAGMRTNEWVDGKMRIMMRDDTSQTVQFSAPAAGIYRVRVRASAFGAEEGQPLVLRLNRNKSNEVEVPAGAPLEHEWQISLKAGESLGFCHANGPLERINAHKAYEGFREDLERHFQRHPRFLAAWLSLHKPVQEPAPSELRLRAFDFEEFTNPVARSNQNSTVTKLEKRVLELYEEAQARPDLDLAPVPPETLKQVLDAICGNGKKNAPTASGTALWYYTKPIRNSFFKTGPAVDIERLEVEGPVAVSAPNTLRAHGLQKAFLGAEVRQLVTPQTRRAALQRALSAVFRREPLPEEISRYSSLVEQQLQQGVEVDTAFHLALRTALVSPQFLYREGSGPGLTDAELASRLAYFLTSLPPDERLRAALADGSLRMPGGLRKEAERLLATPAAQEFVKSFVGQWLGTRNIPNIAPSESLGPFSSVHARAMIQEPELVFWEILRENRPVADFIAPDFTFTHPVVGKQMYGLDMDPKAAPKEFPMTRVSLPREGRVGGLLGMSGIMMATANGVSTQPVHRGKWVLENVFGDPVPPPPESVPALTPDIRNAKTIREMMAAHTSEPSCAGCHRKLDPPGFLLENFDAIGQWRETYPSRTTGAAGKKEEKPPGLPVDPHSMLTDGTPLKDVRDLKSYMVAHIDRFGGAITEKLFLYATGRVPRYAERKILRTLSDSIVREKRGFRDLLFEVIESEPFRN